MLAVKYSDPVSSYTVWKTIDGFYKQFKTYCFKTLRI